MMAGNPSAIQAMIHEHEETTRHVFREIEEFVAKYKVRYSSAVIIMSHKVINIYFCFPLQH